MSIGDEMGGGRNRTARMKSRARDGDREDMVRRGRSDDVGEMTDAEAEARESRRAERYED